MWEDGEGDSRLTDASLFRQCDAVYLDPEWGGVEYREKGPNLPVEIGGRALDACVSGAFRASRPAVHGCFLACQRFFF